MQGLQVHVPPKLCEHSGWLCQILLREQFSGQGFGRCYIMAVYPGREHGHHYHICGAQWLCVLQGSGQLQLCDVRSGEQETLVVGAETPVAIKIAPYISHCLKALGDTELLALVYMDEQEEAVHGDSYLHIMDSPETGV